MTTTAITNKKFDLKKINLRVFLSQLLTHISNSIGDVIITVLVLGLSITYMFAVIHPVLIARVIGYYIFGMIVQLMIRIVHRFDDHYTVDELAELVIENHQSTSERLDRIERNV